MKKTIILLAGYPGTGKTYLLNKILERESDFTIISQDPIKEAIFDEYGYNNLEEKETLITKSWEQYFEQFEMVLKVGGNVISDYPFSEKQRPIIKALSEKYHYQVITIRLLADLDILFERQKLRDLDPSRHLSHIMTHFHVGDELVDRSHADNLLTYEEFIRRCTTRGYDTFELGHLIEFDVSDYSKVDYEKYLNKVFSLLT